MLRWLRRGKRAAAARARKAAEFEHSSRHPDVASLVADHMLDEESGQTANWRPSRRGNSPHHPS